MSSQAATSLSFILADDLERRQLKRPPYARNGQPIRPQAQGTRFGRPLMNASTHAAKGYSCRSLVGRAAWLTSGRVKGFQISYICGEHTDGKD